MAFTIAPGSDFVQPPPPENQANVLVFGDAGQGKTTFATMYAPDPVALISFDKRGIHAAHKAIEAGREILFTEVEFPANLSRLDDTAARSVGNKAILKVIKNVEWAVAQSQKGKVRTILLDTGTEYCELLTLAFRGKADKKGDFGKSKDLINREWWRVCNLPREGNAHLVILARAKAIWENNEPTGRFTYRGFDVMNDAVDWAAQIRFKRKYARSAKTNGEFEMEITKAGVDISVLGQKYTEEDWSEFGPFVYGCMMNYPGTEPEDWK